MGRVQLDQLLAAGDPGHVTEHVAIAKALNGFNAVLPSGDLTGATDQAAITAALAAGDTLLMPGTHVVTGVQIPSNRTLLLLNCVLENADQANKQTITNANWAIRGSTGADRNISVIGIGRPVVRNYRGALLASASAIGDTTIQTDALLQPGTYTIDAQGGVNREVVVVTNGNTASATTAPYTAGLQSAATKAHTSGKGIVNQSFTATFNDAQCMTFVGVTGLRIKNLWDVSGMYSALSTFGCSDVDVSDLYWKHTGQPGHGADGIDIGPDSMRHTYDRVGGTSTDDMFSFFAQRSAAMIPAIYKTAMGLPTASLTATLPDIFDITVRNVDANPLGDNVFRLQCGDGGRFRRMHAKDVVATGANLITIGERTYVNTVAVAGNFSDISIDGFATQGSVAAIGSDIQGLTIRNGTMTGGTLVSTAGAYAPTVKELVVENISHQQIGATTFNDLNAVLATQTGAVLDGVTITGIRTTRADAILDNAGTVTRLRMNDVHIGTAGAIPFRSAVAETGSIDRVTIDTYGASATALWSGAAAKLRMGPNMPILTSADVTPLATTKGSRIMCDNTKQADGGGGTTAAVWVANGTTWIKDVDLGAMAGR